MSNPRQFDSPWIPKMDVGYICRHCNIVFDSTKPVEQQHAPDCPWLATYRRWQSVMKNESNWAQATKQLLVE